MKSFLFLLVICTSTVFSQSASSDNSKDDYTDDAGWSWTLDDDHNQTGEGFRWWKDGGDNKDQLLMQLTEARVLKLYGNIVLGQNVGPIYESDIYNIDELKGYNDLRFDADGDGKHEAILDTDIFETKTKNVVFNYGSSTDLTKVSINTNKKVDHAALTIAGATYIGPKAELAASGSLEKFKSDYLKNYNLWVEDGIVTEDLAFASVKDWKDDVFEADYELISIMSLKEFIKTNKHLPGIPSEKEIKKNGYTAHQMNLNFIQKIEELSLYTIQQEEKIKILETELDKMKLLEKEVEKLKMMIINNNK